MKIRNGFVSNSSSTSFIVSKEQKEEALRHNLKLIAISDIKKWLKQADDMGIDFLVRDCSMHWKIMEMNDGDYITEPYDRDRAYTEEIDMLFSEFQGDL